MLTNKTKGRAWGQRKDRRFRSQSERARQQIHVPSNRLNESKAHAPAGRRLLLDWLVLHWMHMRRGTERVDCKAPRRADSRGASLTRPAAIFSLVQLLCQMEIESRWIDPSRYKFWYRGLLRQPQHAESLPLQAAHCNWSLIAQFAKNYRSKANPDKWLRIGDVNSDFTNW